MQAWGADLKTMHEAYIECALWSSSDEDGKSLSTLSYSIHWKSWNTMYHDCRVFAEINRRDLMNMDPAQAGHDFWLTRNRHGAGFWDRGLGELGDRLTASAQAFVERDLMVGDDGQIHQEG